MTDSCPTTRLVRLMRSDYHEMPCLRLSEQEAQRFWNSSPDQCASAIRHLVGTGFLTRTQDGRYRRAA